MQKDHSQDQTNVPNLTSKLLASAIVADQDTCHGELRYIQHKDEMFQRE